MITLTSWEFAVVALLGGVIGFILGSWTTAEVLMRRAARLGQRFWERWLE